MVTFNVNGQSSVPPRSGGNTDREYARAQASAARAQGTDYAAAQSQASGKSRDESAAWTQHAAAQKAHNARMEALWRKEESQYEAQLRDQARLQHRFNPLSARGRDPLTPSSRSAFLRSANTLEFQAQQHASKYGSSPFAATAFADMRRSVGTHDQAFHTANALRLGNLGQRAAVTREYSELVKIQHELQRIEKITERSAKFASSPTDQSNLIRQRDALLTARSRISSGMSGNSPLRNRIGTSAAKTTMALGAAGALMEQPEVAAVAAIVAAPYVANKFYSGLVSLQQPYLSYVDSTEQISRGGRFRGSDLRKVTMRNGGPVQYTPTFERTPFANRYALGPLDADKILNDYGVGVTGGDDARNVLAAARGAFLSPEMGGLSQDTYSKYLGQGRALGAIQGGAAFNSTSNAYLNQLEKIMTLAVSQGLDRSRVANVMSGLQRQAAAGGALSIDSTDFASLFERLVSSGAPGMRDGSGVISVSQGINNTMKGLGTSDSIPANIVMGTLFDKNGGAPKTEDALRTFLNVNKKDWNSSWVNTPAAQQALINYKAAVANGNAPLADRYLGQLLNGHPQAAEALFEKSPFAKLSPDLAAIALSNFANIPLDQAIAIQSGYQGGGGGSAPGPGGIPGPGPNGRNGVTAVPGGPMQMLDYYKRKYNLTTAQAAGLTGDIYPEGNITGNQLDQPWGKGGLGFMQETGPRRRKMEAWMKANGYDDPTDRAGQLAYQAQEPEFLSALDRVRQQNTARGSADAGFPYENAPGQLGNRENAADAYNTQFRGMTDAQRDSLNKQADRQAADIDASKYVSDATAIFKNATDSFAGSVAAFANAVMKANTNARGYNSDGLWVNLPQSGATK